MSCFPFYMDLTGKTVFLIGQGNQIDDKFEKLKSFGARLVKKEIFTVEDAESRPAFVVVGNYEITKAEAIYSLCLQYGIPVNVVDVPRLCTFYFPALVTRGKLTVSVSSSGSCPAVAGYLRQKIEDILPSRAEEILNWICENRNQLKKWGILNQVITVAFEKNRPLTEDEINNLIKPECKS